ncbi:MAG: nucleotide exchange factor GrpE [Bacilli bacterium]
MKKKDQVEKKCECEEACDCGCNEKTECSCNEEIKNTQKTDEDKKIDVLNDYIKELEEKVLREKAELVNYRKRKDDEIISMLKYSNEDIVKELLTVVDNFERAIKLDDNDLTDELSKFLEGFKMIYASVINVFNTYEVKAIDGVNKPFDPKYHQAVMTEKIDGMKSGLVIEVLQKGYLLKDRVIRPAMVRVSE